MEIGTSSMKECFFKVLIKDFKYRMQIPDAFVKHLPVSSSRITTIQGHGGTWRVKMNRNMAGLYFEEGWEKFSRDLSLATGEFLVFRYDGDMHFSVKVFDRNGCERK